MAKEDAQVRNFESKLSRNPQSLVFSRLADRCRKNGEIQQAIDVCIQGLKSHPDYMTGRVILGRCYLEQEKLKEAIAEFVKVVELDKRNQIAVKMIADICARQGMKEKAGDLYAYLLGMDPENRTLAKIAGTFRGTGDADVMRILGTVAGALEPAMAVERDVRPPPDMIVDVDKTIRLDLGSRRPAPRAQEDGELGGMLVKTQQFDPGEPGAGGITEEIAPQADGKDAGVVTGNDISSRMVIMFGEQESSAPRGEPEVLDYVDIGGDNANGIDDEVGIATVKGAEPGDVSGGDITSRIEQLFGEEETPSSAPLSENAIRVEMSAPGSAAGQVLDVVEDDAHSLEEAAVIGDDERESASETPIPAQATTDTTDVDETSFTVRPQPELAKEESAADSGPEQTQAYSIPDHVLTPTLADIYYQQGQPQLALQIYRRLLEADPGNERIAKRIREIDVSLASRGIEGTVAPYAPRKKTAAPVAPRPLSGVRIRKKFKNKLRKRK